MTGGFGATITNFSWTMRRRDEFSFFYSKLFFIQKLFFLAKQTTLWQSGALPLGKTRGASGFPLKGFDPWSPPPFKI